VRLAEALTNNEAETEAGALRLENTHKLYLVAEIVLCLGYVGRRLRRAAGPEGKKFVTMFREARARLEESVQRLRQQPAPVPRELDEYVEAAFAEYARLAGVPEEA